jgi:hypothetical protein
MDRSTDRTGEGCTYFVTTKFWEDIFWFKAMKAAQIVVEKLLEYRDNGDYLLHDFALTPSCLRLIVTPCSLPLEKCVQLIKGGSSSELHKVRGNRTDIWQAGYEQVLIENSVAYKAHRQFVIQSPVFEKLAQKPESWEWSSASGRYRLDAAPLRLTEKAAR